MARIYVGNLPMDIKESELDDLFYKYGRIRTIDIKTPARPPAYAFITYDDDRDADDAVRARDGYNFDGRRIRVEFSRGRGERGDRRDDRRDFDDRRGGDDRRRGAVGRRSDFSVQVTGLPSNCSWQDLKDHMRKCGDVIYTDTSRNGDGVVEFANREDMERAIRDMDDTEYSNRGSTSFIRVRATNKDKEEKGRESRSRSRDRRSRSRSRDREERRRSPSADRRSPRDDAPRDREEN